MDAELPIVTFRLYAASGKFIKSRVSYTFRSKYANSTKKVSINGRNLLKLNMKKKYEFFFDIVDNETNIEFDFFSKKTNLRWKYDFRPLCRDFYYRKKISIKGVEFRMIFNIANFGPSPESVFPYYRFFSGRYPFNHIVLKILGYLSSQMLIATISTLSRHMREMVSKYVDFGYPLQLKKCNFHDIVQLSNNFPKCGCFCVDHLVSHKQRPLDRPKYLCIRKLQFRRMDFSSNKACVTQIQKILINLPNLEFFCLQIPHDFNRDEPRQNEHEIDFNTRKFEEFVYPIQKGNKETEDILRNKRTSFVGKRTDKLHFLACSDECSFLIIQGFLFSIDFHDNEKSVILYNDTEETVTDIFCRLLLEDVDQKRKAFKIPVLYTRDYLSPDEFRPFDHDDLKFFHEEGVGSVCLQIRFFRLISPENYRIVLEQGNPVEFEEVRQKIKLKEKIRHEVTVYPEEFDEDFDNKSLVTKEIELLGIRWTLEIIGFNNDTYVHLYVSPNMHGETVLHYEGVVIFNILDRWYHSQRNSAVCSSGGIECGVSIDQPITLTIFVRIDRVWQNKFTDPATFELGGRDLQQIMAQDVEVKESRILEINNFYDFSQHYLEMLNLGWIFTIVKGENHQMSVSVERGFGIDIITPVHFHVELLDVKEMCRNTKFIWKIESILCFYTFKGQFYRYGKLPKKPFMRLTKEAESFRLRLTLLVGEKFTTKEEYADTLRKIVEVSKKFVDHEFSRVFEVTIPEDNMKSKLPFIACYFNFAGIKYTCEFSPSRNKFVSITLSHRLPFQSSLMKKEFVMTLLKDGKEEIEEKVKGKKIHSKSITVKTEDSFIDFDKICPSDPTRKVWTFKITMFIKKISSGNFTLQRRIQSKVETERE